MKGILPSYIRKEGFYDMMNKENRKVKRYEIYLYDFGKNQGSIQSGIRPVFVVQDDKFNEFSPTTLIAPLTSVVKKEYLPSHVFIGECFGLNKPSMVLMEQIRTINQSELGDYVGRVDDDHLVNILNRSIKKTFGLWNYAPKNKNTVRCLCPACMHDYISAGIYIVRRLDPFQKEKDTCERCQRPGWDYVITEKGHASL